MTTQLNELNDPAYKQELGLISPNEQAKMERLSKKISRYVGRKALRGETDIPAKVGRLRVNGLMAYDSMYPHKAALNAVAIDLTQQHLAEKGVIAHPVVYGDEMDGFEYHFKIDTDE